MSIPSQISVVIPALNEESTVRHVVESMRKSRLVDDVIVVNNGSKDGTAQNAAAGGANVIECPERGFGRALIAGFKAAKNSWVMKLDADMRNPAPRWVDALVEAIKPESSLVKAYWRNDEDSLPITDMLLRPGFAKLFPGLREIALPSGGIYLVDKKILPIDRMDTGYSFDIDVLIRAHRMGGPIPQVHLGEVYDRLRPISDYREMAKELFAFMVDAASSPAATSLLLLMAHPDDAEIWCGGTLLKHASRGSRITVAIATSDSARAVEARKLVQQIPSADFYFLGGTEFTHFNSRSMVISTSEILEKCRPTVVITHHFDDAHVDHRKCFEILSSALLIAPRRLMPRRFLMCNNYFQSSQVAGNFRPDTYIDITPEANRKHKLIMNHRSQDTAFWSKMIRKMDALNGMKCGVRYAEAYESYGFFTTPAPQDYL